MIHFRKEGGLLKTGLNIGFNFRSGWFFNLILSNSHFYLRFRSLIYTPRLRPVIWDFSV